MPCPKIMIHPMHHLSQNPFYRGHSSSQLSSGHNGGDPTWTNRRTHHQWTAPPLPPPCPPPPTGSTAPKPQTKGHTMGLHLSRHGHPGIQRTTTLLWNSFWWPTLLQGVTTYVNACHICAQVRTPWQLLAGLLVPLPIPQSPWSNLAVDFLTDLPDSKGFTAVL